MTQSLGIPARSLYEVAATLRSSKRSKSAMRALRYAVRAPLKATLFSVAAAGTIAICIGANAAICTVIDGVLFRLLPFPHPERLAMVARSYEGLQETDGRRQA